MKKSCLGFVAAAALLAGPALAERALVPVNDGAAGRGVWYRTELSVTDATGGKQNRDLKGTRPVELELAKGSSATATVFVERADGRAGKFDMPVLTGADNLGAGARAVLQGSQLADGFKKVSVGVVNLSSRPMTCSASYVGADGSELFAPISVKVAPRSELRTGDTFGAGKKGVDVDSLKGVRCDQAFWAYAVAEHGSTGAMKVVYPGKEVNLLATDGTRAGTETSKVFSIPGTFLVAGTGHWSFHYNMGFGAATTWKRVLLDVDLHVGTWDPKKPTGIHLIWWLQKGPKWGTDLLQYFNAVKANAQKWRQNYYPAVNVASGPGVKPGLNYHAHGDWDGNARKNTYNITFSGLPYASKTINLTRGTFASSATFIEFAHPNDGPDGPESRAPGWTWSNFRAEYIN